MGLINIVNYLKTQKSRTITTLIALVSMSIAHYAGFLISLPVQIVAAAGGAMAAGVTGTFIFYVAFSSIFSRVCVAILQAFILPILSIFSRLEHSFRSRHWRLTFGGAKRFVFSYKDVIAYEGYVWLVLQGFLLIVFMLGLYLKFKLTWSSGGLLLLAIFLLLFAGFYRAGFFLKISWSRFKYKFSSRPKAKATVISAFFLTVASALVVLSFFTGYMRMELLQAEPEAQITNQYFSGYASLLASSGVSSLLIERDGREFRYIYITDGYALASESKSKHFKKLER